MEELESEFTGFMENKFLVFIDEIESGRSLYHSRINQKLKNLIVEPQISIRKMYQLPYMVPNYTNMIFASNTNSAVEVPPDDRRFNVGGFQESPLVITDSEVNKIIPVELQEFYNYLMTRSADIVKARKPLKNSAKERIIEINRTAIDSTVDALLAGNLQFFIDQLPSDPALLPPAESFKLGPYQTLIEELQNTMPDAISRDEIGVLLEWCIGDIPRSPNKLTSYLNHHGISMEQIWRKQKNTRGIRVNWTKPSSPIS